MSLDLSQVANILKVGDIKAKRTLFSFTLDRYSDEEVVLKYDLWARYFFPKYFKSEDADFHQEMNLANAAIYRGTDLDTFVNVAFRGAGKDVKTKLFVAFVVLNDLNHFRRYFKVLTQDGDNSKQIVTDIYNMLINPQVKVFYPEVFEKTEAKREERMASFTTSTGVKILADTVNVEQRGAIQEDARPDFVWFNDFETRKTLRSPRETKNIAENMEEARTGLAKGGAALYTCNYISEQGNVHMLIHKTGSKKKVLIVPIMDKEGKPTWDRYTIADIEQMKKDDDDFEGERMCEPSASKDAYFNRERLDRMPKLLPIKTVAGFKIFKEYVPSHRYGSGHDISGGVGLDSSTSVFIDFDTMPAQVVATYADNMIQPETMGDEIYAETNRFGANIAGIENNKYDQAVLKAKLLGVDLFKTRGREIKVGVAAALTYGWNTNSLTKSKMLSAFQLAIDDGLIDLNDADLIAEAKSYTRNDFLDSEPDPTLTTRHFDLLIAACIAWQMKDHSKAKRPESPDPIWNKNSQPKKNPAL